MLVVFHLKLTKYSKSNALNEEVNLYLDNIPYLVRFAGHGTVDFHTRQDPSMDRPPPMICLVLK